MAQMMGDRVEDRAARIRAALPEPKGKVAKRMEPFADASGSRQDAAPVPVLELDPLVEYRAVLGSLKVASERLKEITEKPEARVYLLGSLAASCESLLDRIRSWKAAEERRHG
jgi:hypothetical protein